ncbi:MAG TPA: hypothetical protein VFZ08_13835, partial [Terriglobia bacterium]|nr:hypothetical protein [Terriglobia bacterium]
MQSVASLLQTVFDHPSFQAVVRALAPPLAESENSSASAARRQHEITLAGLTRTAKALVIAGLAHRLKRPLVVLTAEREATETLRQTTAAFLDWLEPGSSAQASVLPWYDVTPYEGRSPHAQISEQRAITLWNISRGGARVVFAPSLSACGRFRDSVYYRSLALELKAGDELSLDDLIEHLAGGGYEAHEPVDSAGVYSVRGGIADVYPPEVEWPFRLEFFGDQIETVRQFDPANQRSRQSVPSALILPLSEHRRSPELFRSMVRTLRERGGGPENGREPAWVPEYSAVFPGWEFFAPLGEARSNTLFQLFKEPLIVWDEPAETVREMQSLRAA